MATSEERLVLLRAALDELGMGKATATFQMNGKTHQFHKGDMRWLEKEITNLEFRLGQLSGRRGRPARMC